MSKKSIRIISTILTIAIVLMMLTTTTFAAITKPGDIGEGTAPTGNAATTIETTGKQIVGLIRTVGIIVAVVILMVLGIKYMMGSSEEKASYKKTMMPYLIGAVLIFGASALAGMVFDFATNLG